MNNYSKQHAEMMIQMEECMGLFMGLYHARQAEKIPEKVFSRSEKARLRLPDHGVNVFGQEEIKKVLAASDEKRKNSDTLREAHLLETPSFTADPEKGSGKGTWDTCSYILQKAADGTWTNEVMNTRFDVHFVTEQGRLVISSLDWHIMQSWKPIPFVKGQEEEILSESFSFAMGEGTLPCAEEFLTLQRLSNSFVFDHFCSKAAEKMFIKEAEFSAPILFDAPLCGREAICRGFEELMQEEKEQEAYRCLMLLGNPFILKTGENTAEGFFLTQTFENTKESKEVTVRRFGTIAMKYEKTDEDWKIAGFSLKPIITLPRIPRFISPFGFERNSMTENNWDYEDFTGDGGAGSNPSAFYAAQNMVNGWVYATRRSGDIRFYEENALASGLGCVFDFKSRGLDAPSLTTEEEIRAKLSVFDRQSAEQRKQPAYHGVTTPVVTIAEDGCSMRAHWVDFCNTNMSMAFGAGGEDGSVPYMAAMNRYLYEFRLVNGRWYLSHWYFEPLMNLVQHTFLPGKSRGWCMKQDGKAYQAIDEDYDE